MNCLYMTSFKLKIQFPREFRSSIKVTPQPWPAPQVLLPPKQKYLHTYIKIISIKIIRIQILKTAVSKILKKGYNVYMEIKNSLLRFQLYRSCIHTTKNDPVNHLLGETYKQKIMQAYQQTVM